MSHSLERFGIVLPPDADPATLRDVQAALGAMPEVATSRQSTTRSVDAATLTLWVSLAGTVVTTIGAAVPVVKAIVDLFRSRGIKGAKLSLANGTVIEADEISLEALERLAGRP